MSDIKLTCPNCGSADEYPPARTRPCSNDCGWEVYALRDKTREPVWSKMSINSTPPPAAEGETGPEVVEEPRQHHAHPCSQFCEVCRPLPTPTPAQDDTEPPLHYRAKHYAAGVPVGAEFIDWIAAMRGPEFAINAMIFEIQTKANRMGLEERRDKIREDCFKVRQACRVIERLVAQRLERLVVGEGE